MKKISTISRIVAGCEFILLALLISLKASDLIWIAAAIFSAIAVFICVYLSRKEKMQKVKRRKAYKKRV